MEKLKQQTKRVGLLTIHWAHNYGAFLQAYATQKIIEKTGNTCEIIDYQSEKQESAYHLFRKELTLSALFGNIRNLLSIKRVQERRRVFQNEITHNLSLSSRRLRNREELAAVVSEYDLLLAGSDQIWNVRIEAFDPVYFLPFATAVKKVSYASSLGDSCNQWSQREKSFLKSSLSGMDRIAVREESGARLIRDLTGNMPEVVLDPTLLLTSEEWKDLNNIGENRYGDYLLFYSVLSDEKAVAYVKRLSVCLGLKVLCPHPRNRYELSAPFIRMSEVGPGEFINLIAHARMVCTTSFHATVFSLLYRKPFYSITYGDGGRIRGLLSSLELETQLAETTTDEARFYSIPRIDYDQVHDLLEKRKAGSLNYLKSILSDE